MKPFLFVCAILSACTTLPHKDEIARYEAEPGYQAYVNSQCAQCHGVYGQGIFSQRSLRGLPLDAAAVIAKVRGMKSDKMPIYGKEKSDEHPLYFISDSDLETLANFYEANWSQKAKRTLP